MRCDGRIAQVSVSAMQPALVLQVTLPSHPNALTREVTLYCSLPQCLESVLQEQQHSALVLQVTIAGMPCTVLRASDTELVCKTSKWDSTVDSHATYASGHGFAYTTHPASERGAPTCTSHQEVYALNVTGCQHGNAHAAIPGYMSCEAVTVGGIIDESESCNLTATTGISLLLSNLQSTEPMANSVLSELGTSRLHTSTPDLL